MKNIKVRICNENQLGKDTVFVCAYCIRTPEDNATNAFIGREPPIVVMLDPLVPFPSPVF